MSETRNDCDEFESETIFARFVNALKSVLYFLTESEMFRPSTRAKTRMNAETYRLIEYKVATPEEMYAQKLNDGNYEEALEIAKLYELNTDIVYQTQWQHSEISIYSIDEYLRKISDKNWVLRECVERVADSLHAEKALIEFGLELTDEHIVIEAGICSDHNQEHDVNDALNQESLNDDIEVKYLNVNTLNSTQQELINYRLKLFRYLSRLKTYEHIIEDGDRFNADIFYIFRNQSSLEAAVSFARDSNTKGVYTMLTYHGNDTIQHWLPILSNFPETTFPADYGNLLPKCSTEENRSLVFEWETFQEHEQDWCTKFSHFCFFKESDYVKDFYDENPDLLEFVESSLTKNLVSCWFHRRARQIEERSSLIGNALKLVELGMMNNVPGLEKLYDDLETYETIVYECIPRDSSIEIEFSSFEKMSYEEKIQILMQNATEKAEQFINRIQNHLIPFLEKCEKYTCDKEMCYKLLSNYLTSIAVNDLTLICKIFEKKDMQNRNIIIPDVQNLISIAIDCIYACEQTNQLQEACHIMENLPQRDANSSPKYDALFDKLDLLDKHLGVADMLEEYNCFVTVKEVREMQNDKHGEEVKRLFKQITRLGAKKTEPVFKEKEWFQMFNDLQEMRNDCFEECITLDETYEIFVQALLTSGRKENFGLASSYMQLVNDNSILRKKKLIPFTKSIEILVNAARDYVNSANSIADDSINLAKECLCLVHEDERNTNESVREEIDFIEALSMLYIDFNIKLLPIQIRLIEQPKLELVVKILNDDSKAFQKWQKLLKICELFRVCKGDEEKVRNGKILTIVGNYAYNANDFKNCWNMCRIIMNNEFTSGWRLCKKLAFSESFDNDEAKLELLSFTVTYCEDKSGKELEIALNKIREIKVRLRMQRQIGGIGKEKGLVDFGVNQVSKTAQQLSSWISSWSTFKK